MKQWVVVGREIAPVTFGSKDQKEYVRSEVVEAETSDEAAVAYARAQSVSTLKRGVNITVLPVETKGENYHAQYQNPDGAAFDGPPLGDLIVTGGPPREVYRG